MEKTYKYRFSRRAIYWTLVYLVVFVLLGWLLYHLYEGGYLSAWFTSFIVALIALMSLSIPRRIVVTDEKVEVRCLLDITEIRRDEIASVRRVLSGIRGLRVLRLLRTFPRPQAVRTRKTLRLGVEKLRGDHRHLRRPPVRLVFGCRPPRGGAYAPRRQPPGGRRRRGRAGAIVSGSGQKVDRRRPGITTPQWAIPTEASPPERSSKRFPKTGFAPSAASAKTCSKRLRNNPVPPRRNGKAHPAGCALPFVIVGARTQAVSSE